MELQAIKLSADQQLAQSATEGDHDAFRRIVEKYRRMVCGYLIRCGVRDVDDLFQEIFLKVHQASHTYSGKGSLRSWIMAITANQVRMYFRSRKPETPSLSVANEQADDTVSAQVRAEGMETAAWLDTQLERLTPVQRQVVCLHCIEQIPQKEVARMLDMPVNTVKTHLHRARAVLTRAMARRIARQREEIEK